MYHLEMNSFTVELVSNASFDCYPNNTLSSFTNYFPERAIRSLKNIIYRYMEENGDKYVHKMDTFVNTMKRIEKNQIFCQFFTKTLLLSTKNHASKLETKFESPSTISHLEKVTSLKSQVKFFKLLKLRL